MIDLVERKERCFDLTPEICSGPAYWASITPTLTVGGGVATTGTSANRSQRGERMVPMQRQGCSEGPTRRGHGRVEGSALAPAGQMLAARFLPFRDPEILIYTPSALETAHYVRCGSPVRLSNIDIESIIESHK